MATYYLQIQIDFGGFSKQPIDIRRNPDDTQRMNARHLMTHSDPWLRATRYLLFAAILAIVAGSLAPSQSLPTPPFKDKVLHFGGYAAIATLALFAIRHPSRQVVGMLLITAMGVALEFGQMFVAGRSFEVWDMAANGGGVLLAFQIHRASFETESTAAQ